MNYDTDQQEFEEILQVDAKDARGNEEWHMSNNNADERTSKIKLEENDLKFETNSSSDVKLEEQLHDDFYDIQVHDLEEKQSCVILTMPPRDEAPASDLVLEIATDDYSEFPSYYDTTEDNKDGIVELCKEGQDSNTSHSQYLDPCFHCGYDCKDTSHLNDHYNVLSLSEPYQKNLEVGYECKVNNSSSRKFVFPDDNQFRCSACKFIGETQYKLKEHISNCHTDEEPFLCSECGIVFKKRQGLAKHLLLHSEGKPFQCTLCSFSCKRKPYLKAHISLFHSDLKPHSCSHCSFQAKTKADLKKHLSVHSDDKPYKCNKCSFKSKSSNYLKKHKLTHSSRKPFHCAECNYQSISKHLLKDHYINHHTAERPYQCQFCTSCFKRKSTLTRHSFTHSNEKPYKCKLCDYSCSRRDNLKAHYSIAHSDDKPFRCNHCNFACKLKVSLKYHMQSHSLSRPFKCNKCTFRFRLESQLRKHVVSHSFNTPVACPSCSFRFKSKADLRSHISSMHSGGQFFFCSICEFTCDERAVLSKHLRTHSTQLHTHSTQLEMPYECKQCNFKFKRKSHYRKHLASCHDNDLFSCPNCIFKTQNSSDFEKHLEFHSGSNCLMSRIEEPLVDIIMDSESKDSYGDDEVEPKVEGCVRNSIFVNDGVEPKLDDCGGNSSLGNDVEEEPKADRYSKSEQGSGGAESNIELHAEDKRKSCLPSLYADTLIKGKWVQEGICHQIKSESPETTVAAGPNYDDHPVGDDINGNGEIYQCPSCDFQCHRKCDLRRHSGTHTLKKTYRCPECRDFTTHTKANLKDHLSLLHNDYKPFKCPFCGQGFKLKSNLKQHSVIHSEDKPYRCTLCDYRSKLRETLKRHYVTHSMSKPFQCSQCDYRCKLKEKLKRHMLIHSQERPFQCPQCEYTCKTKELLKKHAIVHTRERNESFSH